MQISTLISALFEHSPISVVLAKKEDDGKIVIHSVNHAFCEMTGYRREQLIGRNPKMLQGRKTSTLALKHFRQAIEAGKPHRTQLVNYRQNGEDYICGIEAYPLHNSQGEVEMFISFEEEVVRKRGRKPKHRSDSIYQRALSAIGTVEERINLPIQAV